MSTSKNEWEKVKLTLATGAATATNFAVTGIAPEDKVQKILNLTDLAEVALDGLVVSADNIKVTAVTTGKKLLVHWIDRDAG